jgi:hypothetical protein
VGSDAFFLDVRNGLGFEHQVTGKIFGSRNQPTTYCFNGPVCPSRMVSASSLTCFHRTALFGLFCCLMFLTQVQLIMLNQTTVESLRFRLMHEREQDNLARMHGWYDCGCVIDLHPFTVLRDDFSVISCCTLN